MCKQVTLPAKHSVSLEGITTTTTSHQFRDTLIKLNYYITNYNSFTASFSCANGVKFHSANTITFNAHYTIEIPLKITNPLPKSDRMCAHLLSLSLTSYLEPRYIQRGVSNQILQPLRRSIGRKQHYSP